MRTKSTVLILMILLAFNTVHGQNFVWAKQIGGNDFEESRSIAVDVSGNVYTTGSFNGTADFDPGSGVSNFISAGGQDIYIHKLNVNGNFVWAKRIGGTGLDEGLAVALDASGNAYVTGYFGGTVDFNPGPGVNNLTSAGELDIFILKLDANGNFVWAKRMGGSGSDIGWSIGIDPFGNVYTTGWFFNTVDFDPGTGVNNHTSAGYGDIFIQKLNGSGSFLWARTTGGTEIDYGKSVRFDSFGNVYMTGEFQETVDFDPGPGVSNLTTSVGVTDVYIRKMDENGNFLWVKQLIGAGYDGAYSVGVDSFGNVYTTGYFQDVTDFDPGPGVFNLTSSGVGDIFIQKMDSNGNFLWAKGMGSIGMDVGLSLALDVSGNCYTTGYFVDVVDFDPGPAVYNLTSDSGDRDIFVQKLDTNGNLLWVKQMGGALTDFSQSIAVDAFENTYITGYFFGTTDFDPGVGVHNLITVDSDNFIQKMSSCSPVTGSDTITACDSYEWIDGITYVSDNNSATYVLTSAAGCDSTVTLNLIINFSDNVTDAVETCNSHTWIDGITYTSSNNTATHTLTNAVGCDSVITLNLTINSSVGTDVITACNSYTWINGITYTANNNTATDTLTNAAGCDSLVTLNLTINNVSDVTTSLNGITINSNNSNATYQWLRCGDGPSNYTPIANETSIDFTPVENGYYAVEITENGCVDTSDCVAITKVGLFELSNGVKVITYPNPTTGKVCLEFEETVNELEVTLTDVKGNVISTETHHALSEMAIELTGANGIYFLTLQTQTGKSTLKLLKE
jgi:hypothetical protein